MTVPIKADGSNLELVEVTRNWNPAFVDSYPPIRGRRKTKSGRTRTVLLSQGEKVCVKGIWFRIDSITTKFIVLKPISNQEQGEK